MLNRQVFMSSIGAALLPGGFDRAQWHCLQGAIERWEATAEPRLAPADLARCLAMAWHETGGTLRPFHEAGSVDIFTRLYDIDGDAPERARALGNDASADGVMFAGRGLVPLVGKAAYAKATAALQKLGVLGPEESLVEDPDRALDPAIAVALLIEGVPAGWFVELDAGDTLAAMAAEGGYETFLEDRARRHGPDRAGLIAGHAEKFLAALQAAAA